MIHVTYFLNTPSEADFAVVSILGQTIVTMHRELASTGSFKINMKEQASGVYMVRALFGKNSLSQKVNIYR